MNCNDFWMRLILAQKAPRKGKKSKSAKSQPEKSQKA